MAVTVEKAVSILWQDTYKMKHNYSVSNHLNANTYPDSQEEIEEAVSFSYPFQILNVLNQRKSIIKY